MSEYLKLWFKISYRVVSFLVSLIFWTAAVERDPSSIFRAVPRALLLIHSVDILGTLRTCVALAVSEHIMVNKTVPSQNFRSGNQYRWWLDFVFCTLSPSSCHRFVPFRCVDRSELLQVPENVLLPVSPFLCSCCFHYSKCSSLIRLPDKLPSPNPFHPLLSHVNCFDFKPL